MNSEEAIQQYNWFCMNCGGSMTVTESVNSIMGDAYEIERCATCGAEVQ